ncbi:hypothetical protein D6827_03820 [Candidatus Parcubacteria bacterium]|nr:MAG: hypothetical protein D6827_03820 [Candidatus Parcubacteria bacterium]
MVTKAIQDFKKSSYNQTTVSVVSLGLPVAVVFVWILETVFHITVPSEVSAALGSIFSVLIGLLTKNKKIS